MEATAVSGTSDGPVLTVINKRLRALRKKYNRILQMEESLYNGKRLNKEQEETFHSKPSVVAAIDELERLRKPLAAAVTEEINLATKHHLASAADSPDEKLAGKDDNSCVEDLLNKPLAAAVTEEINLATQHHLASAADSPDEKLAGKDDNSCVDDLLNIIYFGNMFNHANWGKVDFVSTMWRRAMHEKVCCLNYDCMPEDESTDMMDMLSEKDLDLMVMLSELLICRPVNSTLSHKHALQICIEHAKRWITKSDQHIVPESDATYAGLRSKLNKIMSSLYFTTEPVFRVEQAVAEYESHPVPVEETVLPVNVNIHVESPVAHYPEKKEEHVNYPGDKSNEIHDSSEKELHQQENLLEQCFEPEVGHKGEGVEAPKEANVDNQQSRSHQSFKGNHRGGGRRGYSNGRGGRRGYSNDRGGRSRGRSYNDDRNPFHDQPGNKQEILSKQRAEPEEVGHDGEGVEDPKDANVDNQQSIPWRPHQNFRGNRGGRGRRGYSNSRGGCRGYSNDCGARGRGRSYHDDRNPYYDQPDWIGNVSPEQ